MNFKRILIIIICILLVLGVGALAYLGYAKSKESPSDMAKIETKDDLGSEFIYDTLKDGTLKIKKYTGGDLNVEIPAKIEGKSVSTIGENAFRNDDTMLSIIIPSSVKIIDECAFYNCAALDNIEIKGNGLETIQQFAFYNCPSLTDMNLPSSVKTISALSIKKCDRLVITCKIGSVAQEYASAHKIKCENADK